MSYYARYFVENNKSQELLMNNVVSHSLELRKQNINKLLSSKRKLISKLNPFQNETSLNNNINNNNTHPYLIQLNLLTIPKEIEIDISKFLYEVTYFNIIYYQYILNYFSSTQICFKHISYLQTLTFKNMLYISFRNSFFS